jgi:hypothetical protein
MMLPYVRDGGGVAIAIAIAIAIAKEFDPARDVPLIV